MLRRIGDKVYYYRYERRNGRSRRVYVAAGEEAARAAAAAAARRAERQPLRVAQRATAARLAEADVLLDDFVKLTEALARAALMAAGYFRHDRGAWRRKRIMTTPLTPAAKPTPEPALSPEEEREEVAARRQIEDLVRRAEQGDQSVMPGLMRTLDMAPSLWQNYCALGALVEATWLRELAGTNLMLLEAWRRQAQALKADVGGSEPSPLEKLLADRVGACWLQVQQADAACGTLRKAELPEQAALRRRQNAAHKRLLQAVKTLAVVRRLLRPALSPVEVATRLVARDPVSARRKAAPAAAAGMVN